MLLIHKKGILDSSIICLFVNKNNVFILNTQKYLKFVVEHGVS